MMLPEIGNYFDWGGVKDRSGKPPEVDMDAALLIAIIAILAFTLLPQLDRYMTDSEAHQEGLESYLSRLAHWVNS